MDVPSADLSTPNTDVDVATWVIIAQAAADKQISVRGVGYNFSDETATVETSRADANTDINTLEPRFSLAIPKKSGFDVLEILLKTGEALFVKITQDTPESIDVKFTLNAICEPASAE